MRAEVILGFEPAPADPPTLVGLSEVLRATVRALVEARTGFDRLARVGAVWDGPAGAPLVGLLTRFSRDLHTLEDAVVDCMAAAESWREGALRRQAQVSDLVAVAAELPDDSAGQDRRTALLTAAHDIEHEHERAAGDLAAAFADLSAAVQRLVHPSADLAAELDAALLALRAALDDWIASEGAELLHTATALADVAALTTVISELIGIAALERSPSDSEGVRGVVAKSPAAHRLIRALRRQWTDLAPATLPEASFAGGAADRSGSLARRLAAGDASGRELAGVAEAGEHINRDGEG